MGKTLVFRGDVARNPTEGLWFPFQPKRTAFQLNLFVNMNAFDGLHDRGFLCDPVHILERSQQSVNITLPMKHEHQAVEVHSGCRFSERRKRFQMRFRPSENPLYPSTVVPHAQRSTSVFTPVFSDLFTEPLHRTFLRTFYQTFFSSGLSIRHPPPRRVATIPRIAVGFTPRFQSQKEVPSRSDG